MKSQTQIAEEEIADITENILLTLARSQEYLYETYNKKKEATSPFFRYFNS